MLRLVLIFFTCTLISSAAARDMSLAQIRGELINQEVVVLGQSFSLTSGLFDWHVVTGDVTTGYRHASRDSYAPESIRGTRGIVVSIEQAGSTSTRNAVAEKDAFGDEIGDSRILNPYINVVVRMLADNLLVRTTGYYPSMLGRTLHLASRADSIKKEVEHTLTQLMGKTLYNAGYTSLLDSTLSVRDLLDYNKRTYSRDRNTNNLTPLKVVDAKFLEAENAVVVKVELPDGDLKLLFGSLEHYETKLGYIPTRLQRLNISAEEKIPSRFSARELAAIKNKQIFRGMSQDALYWSWGYPKTSNDWGRGGKQHIYGDSQYVYVQGGTVTDWQTLQ